MTTFRKTDREFTETLFKNAQQQQSAGSLGSEVLKEFLIDPKTGEMLPVKFENTVLQLDQHGLPVVYKEKVNVLMDCGHRACSLEQVLGKSKYGHTVCTKCQLYTCAICGLKLCDKDVLWLEEGGIREALCPEHEKDIMVARVKTGIARLTGNTLKYLCGWSGDEYDE